MLIAELGAQSGLMTLYILSSCESEYTSENDHDFLRAYRAVKAEQFLLNLLLTESRPVSKYG